MTISLSTVLVVVLFGASLAFANPATLPKHLGHRNAVWDKALIKAVAADTRHVMQNLSINQHDRRISEKPGAGLLPRTAGPNIVIAPQVKEATSMPPPPK
jgi:hypothetical protein